MREKIDLKKEPVSFTQLQGFVKKWKTMKQTELSKDQVKIIDLMDSGINEKEMMDKIKQMEACFMCFTGA
jgi:hypothetical protein